MSRLNWRMLREHPSRATTRCPFRFQLLSPLLAAGWCLTFAGNSVAQPQSPNDIPWNHSLTITRTSSDDNIQNVFRTLLQEDGLGATFGAGVNQTVSFHLENTPINVAFEQLINEHHLTYSYDPGSKTVAINAAAAGAAETARGAVFVTLNAVSYQDVTQAVANLGLGLGGLRYDSQSHTLAISGDTDRTKQIQTLIQNLEDARKKQNLTGGGGAALGPQEVKVIPLRFTDVGPSTRQFQGKAVTVPGIADTLRSVLGIDTPLGATPDAVTAATATTPYGHPRISIDQRTNSVVVQGSPDAIAAVEKIITQLDRPLQMVEIEVLIVTANVGVAKELGVDWRASQVNAAAPYSAAVDTGSSGGQITNGTTGNLFSSNGLDALSLLPTVAAGGTVASFVIRGGQAAIQAQLDALASQDRARILSAPKLVTLDNIAARITRSQNLYVQVDTVNAAGGYGGVGLQEIQTGLTLEITPSVVPAQSDHEQSLVRLNLRAENSAPGSGSFGQIDVNSQEVQTNVLVPDNDTFVIGGLFDDSQINSSSGVPVLMDLPIVGALFRDKKAQQSLGETIFFITPRIVDERSVLQSDIAVKEGSMEYIKRAQAELNAGSADGVTHKPQKPTSTLEEDD
jgi:type III secretion system YscC/HrcC family outer membrane pore protein